MAEPERDAPSARGMRRILALARRIGEIGPEDPALARGRARLVAAVDRAPIPRSRWRLWALAAATVLLLVTRAVLLRPEARITYQLNTGAELEEGYLRGGSRGAAVRFSEGSTIALAPGARGRIAGLTADGGRVRMEEGGARFHIVHRRAAAWIVEAGPFTVEVTGTAFTLGWEHERLDLTMSEGSVVVRGPMATGGIALREGQRLLADVGRGELTITDPRTADPARSGAAVAPLQAQAVPPDAEAAPAPVAPRGTASSGAPASAASQIAPALSSAVATYRERVARGDFAGVIADAESRGVDVALAASPLSELAALADAARYAQKNDLARRALLAERERFGGSSEARSAAFLLGRLAEPSSPAAAIDWYDRYLAESPGGPLAAEALGRKMLMTQRAGCDAAARPIAEDYLRRYPDGAVAKTARAILGEP